jgi:hypothetical protein
MAWMMEKSGADKIRFVTGRQAAFECECVPTYHQAASIHNTVDLKHCENSLFGTRDEWTPTFACRTDVVYGILACPHNDALSCIGVH